MKTYLTGFAALALVAGLLAAPTAQAQTALGVNAQYGLDYEEFQLGAEFHLPFRPVEGLSFVPNAEFYIMDEPTLFSLNADVHYAFGQYTRSFTPYAGLGLAITRRSVNDRSNTEAGLNVIGGANFRTGGNAMPFFQLEWRTGGYEDLSLGGGLRFRLR